MSVEKRITDVSEKYALMCKKANEYLKVKINPNNLVYASMNGSAKAPTVYIVTEDNINDLVNPVRVFSQRELEKLIFEPDKTCVENFLDYAGWIKSKKIQNYFSYNSMEQLTLCYLMEKVYDKVWNGEQWINL